jgi:excisionase family DNA binding protein
MPETAPAEDNMAAAPEALTKAVGPAPEDLDAVADGLAGTREACTFLSVSRSTLYALMESGQLRYAKVGKSRRLPWRELRAFAAKCLAGG